MKLKTETEINLCKVCKKNKAQLQGYYRGYCGYSCCIKALKLNKKLILWI